METKETDYDVKFRELPVKIGGKPHVLRELDGFGRDAYTSLADASAIKDSSGRVVGVKDGGKGLEAALLALCLYDLTTTPSALVPKAAIEAWPARVRTILFTRAQALSELSEAPSEGNVPAASGSNGSASPAS